MSGARASGPEVPRCPGGGAGIHEQLGGRPDEPLPFTADARALLDGGLREALEQGGEFVETAHLALACSRADAVPSIGTFVAGRERCIRAAALAALERSAALDAELRARRAAARARRSLDARREALQRANQVRSRRAQLKRDLRGGRVSIEQVLRDPPDCVATMKVFDLLVAVPKYGRVKATRLLASCGIAPSTTIAGVSPRERQELVASL